jgi:hypothetical protein
MPSNPSSFPTLSITFPRRKRAFTAMLKFLAFALFETLLSEESEGDGACGIKGRSAALSLAFLVVTTQDRRTAPFFETSRSVLPEDPLSADF